MGIANQGVTPGRATLVEAVNVMLEAIGESPVATLEGDQHAQAAMAERKLLDVHRDEQIRGWSWNTRSITFVRDVSTDEIVVPRNIASFCPEVFQYQRRYSLRGQRVFDLDRGTFVMVIPSIEATCVEFLSWDDCPQVFNRYATLRAAVLFSDQALGNSSTTRVIAADANQAWQQLLVAEDREARPNMLADDGYGASPQAYHPSRALAARVRRYV